MKEENRIIENITKNITEICTQKKITITKMLKDCGINTSFITDMKKKEHMPSIEKINKIANYLNISIDYLIGNKLSGEINNYEKKEIINILKKLAENEIELSQKILSNHKNLVNTTKIIIESIKEK